MNKQQTVTRGREASSVLDNEAFKAAMASLKGSVVHQWKECNIRDRETQVLLLQMSRLADDFERILVGMIEQGNFAQREINVSQLKDEPQVRKFFTKVFNG